MHIFIILLSLIFFSCSELGDDTSLSYEEQAEHSYNYKLLENYFYKPERIKGYDSYKNMEIDSMYASLQDYLNDYRYTRYYNPDIAQSMLNNITHSDIYYSFGFLRVIKNDTLNVYAVFPNSPANKAGLKKGDKLLKANSKPITAENILDMEKSDNPFSDTTIFEIKRGDSILTINAMIKQNIARSTVFLDTLVDIPVIRVTEFTTITNDPKGTYQEFKNILQELKNTGTETAIIDLRNNPGGSILHCTKMAAELLPKDKEMLYDEIHFPDGDKPGIAKDRYFGNMFKDVSGDGIDIKWIILQNKYSASCSERFAAAVTYVRPDIKIIGENSYGKGIGQYYMLTLFKGLAYITGLQTFYPNGETFHEVGIPPDIPADPNSEDIYIKALEEAYSNSGILSKRSNVKIEKLIEKLPEYNSSKKDLGAYFIIED